jgi:xanthine dehydrogenase accessory factor
LKHWQETAALLGRAARLAEDGRRAAMATVVRIVGSAYRRPGAKLLVDDQGGTRGSVSGGCLEADVREVGLAVLGGAAPRLLHYDTGSDDRTVWGLGLGCNGSVDILVQPATTTAALESGRRIRELLRGDSAFAVSTVLIGERAGQVLVFPAGRVSGATAITGDAALDREIASAAAGALAQGVSVVQDVGGTQVFTEVLVPPPHVVLFGAGDDAIPLARFAAEAGFRVTVVDHRPAFLDEVRFPADVRLVLRRPEEGLGGLPTARDTYAVVKAHSLATDREWLRQLVATEVPYIGLLGPRQRTEEILRQIQAAPDGRIYGPVGLDLGAEGPEQVALSIVAELLAARAGREPRHLRAREGSIHAS